MMYVRGLSHELVAVVVVDGDAVSTWVYEDTPRGVVLVASEGYEGDGEEEEAREELHRWLDAQTAGDTRASLLGPLVLVVAYLLCGWGFGVGVAVGGLLRGVLW